MRWIRPWVVLLLLGVAGTASAQEADILMGRVLGPDGKAVIGARVEVMSIETEITRSILTNDQGRYMIQFPDGGGRYLMRITYIGLADIVRTVAREGSEEILLTNVNMTAQAIALDAINVAAQRQAGSEARTGEQSTELSQELLNRLPLPDLDPNTLALLAAGVIGTGADSLTGRLGFSVAGMSDLLNQMTLDGIVLGEGGMGVPEVGVRQTQVTTSTFDASRGGFAGGQVNMSTARGGNRSSGRFDYGYDSDALQWTTSPNALAFTRHNIQGQYGGPVLRNKLFFSGSMQLNQNTTHRFALSTDDPLAAQRAGASPDSIGRFLAILRDVYGVPIEGQTGPYNEVRNDLRILGRVDWNLIQRQGQSHTIQASFNTNLNGTDSTSIRALDLAQNGGDTQQDTWMASATLTSRIRQKWTNNLRASFNESENRTFAFAELPEGQVRVTSDYADGTRGTGSLFFGGDRNMPQESYSKNLQLTEDLSFTQLIGNAIHRLKVGASVQKQQSNRRDTNNLLGTFTFNSLADFEAGRADRYERSPTERYTRTATINSGVYFGDTWRVSVPLEITLGLRWDRSSLDQKPEYNPLVEQLFGRRTDIDPVASGWSPRIGFNYRLNQQGQPARSLSGGLGLFAGRAPTNIFSTAVRQTGLPSAEQRISCIGDAVPIPDWDLYLQNPDAVPLECTDGTGAGPVLSSRAPTVTLINPDQKQPSSLRADLGYRTQLTSIGRKLGFQQGLPLNVRYNYSRGYGLWGYRDINLDEGKTFTLANENRPFFGDPSAIVERTGSTSMTTSRKNEEFAAVYDVLADRHSESHQATFQLTGMLPNRSVVSLNYTLGFARDQASGSFQQATTAGNPNTYEWATSSNDRRHTLNLNLSYPITQTFQVGLNARLSSGAPFTPMVNRDINGDGSANDRAFIFAPGVVQDTALANGMNRLLGVAPDRVSSCLTAQLGQIADRNSCRNAWTHTLNMNAGFRPNLPQFGRRITFTAQTQNMLTGLDQLINGRENMKGWGEGTRADQQLLQVRGFDPMTQAFRYEVNEGFGQTRRGPNSFRNGFSITLRAQMAIGGNPQQSNVGFGQGIAGGFGGGFGGGGGGGGRGGGGGGGFAGGGGGGGGGGRGGFGGTGDIMAMLRDPNGAMNIDSIIGTMFTNPVTRVVQLKDSIALTEAQLATVQAISDTLVAQHDRRRVALNETVMKLLPQVAPGGGGNPGELMQQFQLQINPHLEGGRRESTEAMTQVQRALTPEQWTKLPPTVRNAGQRAGGPGGRGAGFNAVGMIDRMLVNPVPVILALKDSLQMTPEQVVAIEKISTDLNEKLNQRRTQLGRRFDNVDQQQQGRIFQEIQPELDAGRKDITDALRLVERALSKAQWEKIPERVRNPLQGAQGPGGGRRGGGGGQ